jgi:hypothetical protein
MGKVRTWLWLATAVLAPMSLSGCLSWDAWYSMGVATPVPVPPWVTERMEDKYCWANDFKTTILPPIPAGSPPPICEDPPDLATVLRAMPRVKRGVPYYYEEFRDDIEYTAERLVDKIDPGRFYPLIGPAQLHHCHWKCTVYYTETVQSDYPFPFKCVRHRVEVIYIDRDHLHLCPGPNTMAMESVTRDLTGP